MNKMMMMNGVKKMALAALVLLVGIAQASPASAVLKYGKEGIVAVAEKVGLKTTGTKTAVRGGAEFATFRATQKAAQKVVPRVPVVAETVKAIRPGQILAVGGAVAAVEGTHQLTDGAQKALTSAGKALEQDPQAAGKFLDGVFKPVGIAWGIVVLAGAVLLAWMLFPFFTLVRTCLGRKTHQPVAATDSAGSGGEAVRAFGSRSGFTCTELVIVIGGFLLLTLLNMRGCLSDSRKGSVSGTVPGRILPPLTSSGERFQVLSTTRRIRSSTILSRQSTRSEQPGKPADLNRAAPYSDG